MALYDAAGDHAKAIGCYGTGVRIKKTASDDIQCAISFDQVMANKVGDRTRFPSLELGLDYGRMEGGCDPGYACIYSNNVSWKDAKTPAIKRSIPASSSTVCSAAPRLRIMPGNRATSRRRTIAPYWTTPGTV
jgi:hypothetical protein